MNDIQKAIDELAEGVWHTARLGQLYTEQEIKDGFLIELKSLLEQVAKEQRGLCLKNWSKPNHNTDELPEFIDARRITTAPLVTENLTFNEE